MPRFDVSVVGELNLDLIFYGLPGKLELEREYLAKDFTITLGSSSAIFAHNFASLGNRVGFNSSMGSDPLGEIALQSLSESGADVSGVRKFPGKLTGVTVILPSGTQRYILTYPGTMFQMRLADLDLEYVLDRRWYRVKPSDLPSLRRARAPESAAATRGADNRRTDGDDAHPERIQDQDQPSAFQTWFRDRSGYSVALRTEEWL